jgi:DNA-directed RNA polymerase specialized sigma24 family protein
MIDSTSLVDRPHPGRLTVPLALAADERRSVEEALRPAKAEQRIVLRAQALLMLSDGVAAMDVAKVLGVNERTVRKWRKRFACSKPSAKLADAPRSGRPPSLSATLRRPESSPRPAVHPVT